MVTVQHQRDGGLAARRRLFLQEGALMRTWFAYLIATLAVTTSPVSAGVQTPPPSIIAPLMSGDEPIVVTTHTIQTPEGPLTYEARAGRLPIRVDETGEVHAHVFFVAYVVKNRGKNRPLTIAWNGGPTIASIYVHTEFLGPRRITKTGFVDNPLTLLKTSDLVFYDPVETGFSRVAHPRFAPEFFNMKGDVAAAAEFVRAYRARFDAQTQPLFILGESYGVWRTAAVGEFLAHEGVGIAGLVLVSGGFPSVRQPMSFWNAMNIPTRAATALFYHRLDPTLMRDPRGTERAVKAWVDSTYLPALRHPETLSKAQRDSIIRRLAAYTGVRPNQIDPKTMVMTTQDFLTGFFDGDKKRELADVDTRVFGEERASVAQHLYISHYLREELGYATDLGYTGELGYASDLGYRALEAGYVPTPGPARRSSGAQWIYNQTPDSAAALAAGRVDGEVAHMFNSNPPWTQNAMTLEPTLRVFVALGRYDPTNSCDAEERNIAGLQAELSKRVVLKCYDAGHMMYRDDSQRPKVMADLARFEADAVAAQAAAAP
jgi:carboxypeptidase C (cathepsin A)